MGVTSLFEVRSCNPLIILIQMQPFMLVTQPFMLATDKTVLNTG